MRRELERGSGSVVGVALVALVVTLGVGVVAGATTLFRITNATRTAELAAYTVAMRALAGIPNPCAPPVDTVVECVVDGVVATVTVERAGATATATAGPAR